MGLTKVVIVGVVAFGLGAAIFFVSGWFGSMGTYSNRLDTINELLLDRLEKYKIDKDFDKVSTTNLRNNLKEFSSIPHVAGRERDEYLANHIKKEWENAGLDSVMLNPYEILLSYPNPDKPNMIKIINEDHHAIFTSRYREDYGPNQTLDSNFVDAFLAYSPKGEVIGDVVYVNYGNLDDFAKLTKPSSLYYTNLTDKICMMRFGQGYRGNKVRNAQDNGCSGAIIFSDPSDVAAEGITPDQVYPNKPWLPGSGMQRGGIALDKGDPETPTWPSLPNVYRLDKEEVKAKLPSIPAQTIGYDDAKEIFSRMQGRDPPTDWKGSDFLPYTIGGTMKCPDTPSCSVVLTVNNELNRTVSSNVIGILKGAVEPDRYVMIGNHRDAWGFGSVDPNSGTAQLMEVVRILGEKVKTTNWRPRRTMVFLSWGAEEFGLIGSKEFNEDFMVKLMERSVAYINVDICMSGPVFQPSASPTLQHMVMEASKAVPDPVDDSQTLYQAWRTWSQQEGKEPSVKIPGSGSDHTFFIFYNGIPIVDLSFRSDSVKYPAFKRNYYSAYHTGFETFDLVDKLLDPGFKYHASCTKLSLKFLRELSDSLLLDFKLEAYAELMNQAVEELEENQILFNLTNMNVETKYWIEAIENLTQAIADFNNWFKDNSEMLEESPLMARIVNDQISKLDRLFLLNEDLPNRSSIRHAIISPSQFNSYGSSVFPGIGDLMHGINDLTGKEREDRIKDLKKHVSDLMILLKAAADYLKDVSLIL